MENLKETLGKRITLKTVRRIAGSCSAEPESPPGRELIKIALSGDSREAYNALWILTHLPPSAADLIRDRRASIIDRTMQTGHVGCRRLLLTLLTRFPARSDEIRTDFLDFCLSRINSTEPYGVRALCLKQACALCSKYPELRGELRGEIELMECGTLSPGLLSARRAALRLLK